MSFYTSLTGLNAATAQLGVTSNNIANVSTVGFKRSRTDFGDIFATSPLQKASATIGQGVSLKRVTQEFGQGNMMFSSNTLDMAISGDGFFPLKSQDGFQDMFTRNGAFMMNDQFNVVNSAGQRLLAASVDSSGKADLGDLNILTIPQKTSKMAKQTSKIQLGLNFPADAAVITKKFDKNDPTTFNKSTALTIYDEGGNSYLATVFYAKTQNASATRPNNKWQTYVYVGENLINSALQQATNSTGDVLYVNKYGQLKAKADFKTPLDIAALNSSFAKKTQKFSLDDLTDIRVSTPAKTIGGSALNLGTGSNDGVDFATYSPLSKTDLLLAQGSSSISYQLVDDKVATFGDTYEITLKDDNGLVTDTIVVSGKDFSTPPKGKDIVNKLNNDKVFAANYIAEFDFVAKLEGLTFTTDTKATDFYSVEITIDGVAHTIKDLKMPNPTLGSDFSAVQLAQELEKRLRVLDHGENNFKVSGTVDGPIIITDSKCRALSGIQLNVNDAGTTNGTVFDDTATTYTTGPLKVTALDAAVYDDATPPVLISGGFIDIQNKIDFKLKTFDLAAPDVPIISNPDDDHDGVVTNPNLAGFKSIDDLKDMFTINLDNSNQSVMVGLDKLAGTANKLSGSQLAIELTNSINRAYGDEKSFDYSKTTGTTFSVQLASADPLNPTPPVLVDLTLAGEMKYEDLVRHVQTQIDLDDNYKGIVTVSYSTNLQELTFTTKGSAKLTVSDPDRNIGLADMIAQGVNDESLGLRLTPDISEPALLLPTSDQRYGAKVEYDPVKTSFVFSSGTTGDKSSVKITNIKPNSLATQNSKGLGLSGEEAQYATPISKVDALRGIVSVPAVLLGNPMAVNVANNFQVDKTNNQLVVSVNGITGTVIIPPKEAYTLDTFMEALQTGINNLQSESKDGLSAETVDGVKVSFDIKTNALKFTSGTASTNSYIKVEGSPKWGLVGLDAQFGKTTSWTKPTQFTDENGGPIYIDGFGAESSNASGFETLPSWSPVYFDKGELTFDTTGNLISPKLGVQLETVYLPSGKGKLNMVVDYSKSTQFATPYAVLSQDQDGAPEGDLVGLAISDDGLVKASYSNAAQISLAKVVLVNFSNPAGLRQIGDTTYFKTSDSGAAKFGEAGSAGFGTVRSGATERANVDLTQELVDLITEQRNFQANAKAMETSTSMTQTIIQIRA